jgi:hypothetical protein
MASSNNDPPRSRAEKKKTACIIYVDATANMRGAVRKKLQDEGFEVREVKASIDDASAAQAGNDTALPPELKRCIEEADLCVFLLPEAKSKDGLINAAAGLANALNKRAVGIVSGKREDYPVNLDDRAAAMVREGSSRISDAFKGKEIWEKTDGSATADRPIKHIKCQ